MANCTPPSPLAATDLAAAASAAATPPPPPPPPPPGPPLPYLDAAVEVEAG